MESEAKTMRVRRSRLEIAQLITTYRQSGQGQREFCQQRGIGLSSLQNYLRRERTRGRGGALLEVEVVPKGRSGAKHAPLELITANGYRIGIGSGFEAADLLRLVEVVERIGALGRSL